MLGRQPFQYRGAAAHLDNGTTDETSENIQEGRQIVNEARRKRDQQLAETARHEQMAANEENVNMALNQP